MKEAPHWIFDLHNDMYLEISRGGEGYTRGWADHMLYSLLVLEGVPRIVAAVYWADARISGWFLIRMMRRYYVQTGE